MRSLLTLLLILSTSSEETPSNMWTHPVHLPGTRHHCELRDPTVSETLGTWYQWEYIFPPLEPVYKTG